MSPDPRIPRPLRIGVGGPVGSGKTALVEALCVQLRERYDLAVITNDIYTQEDAQFLIRRGVLPQERVLGVETGGCPHTAIREDASMNLAAVDAMDQSSTSLPNLRRGSGLSTGATDRSCSMSPPWRRPYPAGHARDRSGRPAGSDADHVRPGRHAHAHRAHVMVVTKPEASLRTR